MSLSTDSSAPSSASSAASPASRLRLSVPAMSHVQIGPEELAPLLAEGGAAAAALKGWGSTTVLDVRGSDYAGGHVRGSVHVPFSQLEEGSGGFDSVVAQLAQAATRRLVVLDNSRQEAPVAAESILSKFKEAHPQADEPTVYVLTSGFPGLLALYVDVSADRSSVTLRDGDAAAQLIADFEPSAWTAVSVPRTPSNAALPSSANVLVHKSSLDSAQRIVSTPKDA